MGHGVYDGVYGVANIKATLTTVNNTIVHRTGCFVTFVASATLLNMGYGTP